MIVELTTESMKSKNISNSYPQCLIDDDTKTVCKYKKKGRKTDYWNSIYPLLRLARLLAV